MTSTFSHLRRRTVLVLLLALALTALMPGGPSADAAPPTTTDDIPAFTAADSVGSLAANGAQPSRPTAAPMAFSMIGFRLPDSAALEFRTAVDGKWSEWHQVEAPDPEEGPDADSPEADDARLLSEPYWVEAATHVQVRVRGATPADIGAHIVDSRGLSASGFDRLRASLRRPWTDVGTAAQASADLNIITREEWDPNGDCTPKGDPSYATNANFAVVHHTAGSNNYTDGKAVVRGICLFHTNGNGWNDIGYNLVVDKWGGIYEGRRGGLDRAVIGAHARDYNTGSIGISLLGNFETAKPTQAAQYSIARALAWKFRLHRIQPYEQTTAWNGETVQTIVGHRDVGQTTCPGQYLYSQLDWIEKTTAELLGNEIVFSDVGGTHEANINRIVDEGITLGCASNKYCPQAEVTRAQMASFLTRASSQVTPRWAQHFTDISVESTHGPDVIGILDVGVTEGCTEDRYCPRNGVTRAQMATFLVRAIGLEPIPEADYFSDVSKGSTHAPSINALYEAGVTQGCGGTTFCPGEIVTRAQMATFLARALDAGLRGDTQ